MILSSNNLNIITNKPICLCIGCFDILHVGHLDLLIEASKDATLVVGVLNDSLVKNKKNYNRPINKQENRLKIIDSLKVVDYSFIVNGLIDRTNNESFFWDILVSVIDEVNPDFLCCGNNTVISDDELKYLENKNILLKTVGLTNNISTSSIIDKIRSE